MRLSIVEMRRQMIKGDLGITLSLLFSIIIALITFPAMNPVYANGIDPPLAWVFNYLVQGRLELGKEIIFPHGPLAFIMYPLPEGNNLQIAAFIHFLLRAGFAFSLLRSRVAFGASRMLVAMLIALTLLSLIDILLIVTGLVIMGYMNYLLSRSRNWLILPAALTALALFVKAFVGVVCVMISVAFLIILTIEITRERRSYRVLMFVPVIPVLTLAVWLILYGTPEGLLRYFTGMIQLAGDNSAAVAYYPDNNWWVLGAAFGLLCLLVLAHLRHPAVMKYILLIAPALFAVWKYGMAREDYLHAGMFFLFVVMVVGVFLLVIEKRRWISIAAVTGVIIFLFLNLRNAYYYEHPVVTLNGVKNLSGLAFNFLTISDTSRTGSVRNIQRNRLDSEILAMIGNSTVDIYPWDYSFVPANGLNWKPRPVLQSYASYTPWLDYENASHFGSPEAPDFLIWELRKITRDIHGGTLESIDGRYLLNDQPEAVLSILSNYRLVASQGGTFPVKVYRRMPEPLRIERMTARYDTLRWDEWYEVFPVSDGVMRLKAEMIRNTLGDLKSFLYKDEACYIYYLLSTGETRIYRLVPKNAAEGIWVNPLVINGENNLIEPAVEKIMLRCSNPSMMQPRIPVAWEHIRFAGDSPAGRSPGLPFGWVHSFFGKSVASGHEYRLKSSNDMEKAWSGWSSNPDPVSTPAAKSGMLSSRVGKEKFSLSFEIPLDTLLGNINDTAWMIRTDAWVYAGKRLNANFVISLEENNKSVIWKAVKINDFIIERNQWNYITHFLQVSGKELENRPLKLKVYAWNLGENEFYLDDMRVMISAQ